ncbi:hypothetical protein SEA_PHORBESPHLOWER_7 [Gordonia phage PhorbesPhlower]|nr:hypothetical protein SEA_PHORBESPHLOWER_7 [Gordonia phage PhorbesPhlower]UUG69868.1 hypothetical protein SEA_MORKIE_7 [Gordonia phage Morkie]
MPRLKHKVNGGVVNVDDELAEKLGSEWESVDAPKRRGRQARQSEDSDD